jgi:hypothetical protein
MFKALAEGWNWTPEQIAGLTPTQLIKLSGKAGATGGGGAVSFHPSQYAEIRRAWMEWNSEDALVRRGERRLQHYLAHEAG